MNHGSLLMIHICLLKSLTNAKKYGIVNIDDRLQYVRLGAIMILTSKLKNHLDATSKQSVAVLSSILTTNSICG